MDNLNSTPIHDGKPYFMGQHALVKFSTGEDGFGKETYWLVDKANHTVRPFESETALHTAFGEDLESALNNVVVVAHPTVDNSGHISEGVLTDFTILDPDYSIKEDGTSKNLHVSPHQLRSRYGKPVDEELEHLATEVVDGFMNLLKTNEAKTKIPADFINKMRSDNQHMAFYISAMAYGKYTLSDIYSDILHRYKNKL